jgi:glycosyltransferase involved in cell wall biosynthesis
VSDLRVAFVTGNYNAILDGVSLTSQKQVAALLNADVPVRIYAPVNRIPAIAPHAGDLVTVPSIPIVPPYRLAVGLPPSIKRDLADFRPNLVHIATPDLLGVAAQEWARRRKIPVVTTFHTHFSSYTRYYGVGFLEPVVWRLMRWFYRRCREVYVASPSMIGELKAHGIEAPFVAAPFGVDAERFGPHRWSAEWRARHGFAEQDVLVLFVGRLVWEKGLATFAETCHELMRRCVPHRPVIVGEGPAGGDFRKRLPSGQFLGRLNGEELATAFASSDLFFFPSASETFGLVTLEAQASGLPAIVADATGSRDIVRHGIDGLIVPPGNVPGFADALEKLIRYTQLRAQMGAAAAQNAAGYRWSIVLDRMVANFRRAAEIK